MEVRGLVLSGLMLAANTVFAGAADDAQAHFKAIADGKVDQVMGAYGDGAVLQWVGGPLNGTYASKDKLMEVWMKFTKNNAPAELSVSKVEESMNPAGATVVANVVFKAKNDIKVRYVLVYRDGKIVNEVWQIDPKLMY